MWPQVEAAWAAATQVVISGVTGPDAAEVNGRFEQVEREVYAKVGELDRWLFVDNDGNWMVGDTADKDARKTESLGVAYSVDLGGGMPPPAGPGRWKVRDSTDGTRHGWVEQTVQVEVLDAAQAWQQVGAPQQHDRSHSLLPFPDVLRPGVCVCC